MATKLGIDKLQKQAEKFEQAAQEARQKAAEVAEHKERKQAEKEAREQSKKDEKSRKMCREKSKDDEDIPRSGATIVMFYPIYQQIMSQLSSKFVTHMKEEKNASLNVQFITKVIQHVGALDTSVRDVSVQEVLQMIKDRNCKYITGVDDDEFDDNVMEPVDIIRTFDRTELTKAVQDTISKCFGNMTEAHALIWDAFIEASELVHVLPKRGMVLLLEAMAIGSIVVQDTKAFNILQEAKAHRRIHKEIKSQENKMCAIDLQIERQRNQMLPNWKHSIFHDHECGSKIGKIAAAVAVYVRFLLDERVKMSH